MKQINMREHEDILNEIIISIDLLIKSIALTSRKLQELDMAMEYSTNMNGDVTTMINRNAN